MLELFIWQKVKGLYFVPYRRWRCEELWGGIPLHTWRRKWQPTPVFLSGEFHGQRSLVGYSPWGGKESDMSEWLTHTHTHTHTHTIAHYRAFCHLTGCVSLTPFFSPYHFLFPFWNKYHILSLVTCRMFTLRLPPKKVLLLNSSKWVSRQLPTVGRVCFSSSVTPYLRPHPPQGDPHPVTEWGGSITAVLFPPHVRH